MTDETSVIKQLDFVAGTINIHSNLPLDLSALKYHYVQQAKRFGDEGIDSIYFSGEFPSVYFKSVDAFTPEIVQEVIRIQRKVWNQGKVPFLYVESPTEVRVYNCYEKPRKDNQDDAEEELRLIQASKQAKKGLDELQEVFNKVAIESGGFWQTDKYASRVDVKKRVDEALITNIKKTRLQLRSKGLTDDIIHDLLLRSLFVLYLEDRKATDQAFYEQYLPQADSYFKILTDLQATYRLFEKLETTFNGNLCPVQDNEWNVVTLEHLDEIKRCFWSDWALLKQPSLFDDWRIFDFAYIPIQVISEIYEDFLRKEVGTEQMDKNGAFYTSHALAEFILNQVLPYPSSSKDDYNVRTLDPTCGSGIFLVDSLNRLLDRWEYAHPDQKLTFDTIKDIVLNNIFGIEIESEAIKVAAFSIYLAMLDRLDPKTLWQNNRFPYLIYDEVKPQHQRGRNLFLMSSLSDGPFVEQSYDLVVGNPPFTNKVSKEVMAYLTKYKFGKETVIAFLHRVTDLCPTGKIALISTSKILFNNGSGYQRFRKFLFQETYVEKVYNFSALRRVSQHLGGRNLFASATRPVSVLIYSKQSPDNPSDRIIYYTPTTAIKNRLIDGIAIDPTDVKYLPRTECQQPDTKIWKAAMWGTERDFNLVSKFDNYPPLNKYLNDSAFKKGVGFRAKKAKPHNYDIREYPFMDASSLERYFTLERNTSQIDLIEFKRLGSLESYKSPHVLIKEGQKKKRFCSSFIDFDCSFNDSIYGIYSEEKPNDLKILTAYLNSKLASYVMFLTAADWGVERERVKPNELLDLPDLCFILPIESQQHIIKKIEEIVDLKKEPHIFSLDYQIAEIEKQIEISFWDGLNLSDNDRILIEDLLTYRLGAFQDRHKSEAFLPVKVEYSQAYATQLCQTINHFLKPDDSIQARAEYFDLQRSTPLQVIILHIDEQKNRNIVEQLPSNGIDKVLRKLEEYTYKEEAESIYFRRFLRYYDNDIIYIVKPNERRFWSRSMALNDADEIILEILTSEV